ncbi:MAG: hypothetical protein R3E21_11260 [Caenibius sp.]
MKAVYLMRDALNGASLAPLHFPVLHRDGPIDAAAYRRRATGEDPPLVYNLDQSAGLRTIHLANRIESGAIPDIAGNTARALTIVIDGQLQITTGEQQESLSRGDIALICADACGAADFGCSEGTKLLQLALDDDWPATGSSTRIAIDDNVADATSPNLKRLYRADNARSYFREFRELFAAPSGVWSDPKPVDGFRFMSFPDGGFIDWHPEIVNNLAIILNGVTELEAADGAVEHFHPGDVCLAEDRTGEGHIDRFRGFSVLALVEIATGQLW